jgi:GntR family transcriptional regulator/MocR family aminotransferase
MAWLPADLDERAVVSRAAAHGLAIAGVEPYRIEPGRGGLIFGYSNLSERALVQGVQLLAAAVTELRTERVAKP